MIASFRFRGRRAIHVLLVLGLGTGCFIGAVVAEEPVAKGSEAAAVGEHSFVVHELRVLGNKLLDARDIERLLIPYLGEQRTLDDVEKARKALETLYHDRGYGTVYVDIPDQTVDEGIVRLRVTEAALDRVRITGARYFSAREIRLALPEARSGIAPSLPKLQAELADVNRISSDRAVVPVLKAGAKPGTVDLELKVDDHLPLHASLELNNLYTAQTKPLRLLAGLSYDHLFARFDSLALQYTTAPQDTSQVRSWLINYGTHVFDDRTRLAMYYFKSDSAIATLGTSDATVTVLGNGSVWGTRLIHPMSASENSLHTLTAGVDYKDFLQNVGVRSTSGNANDDSSLATPISYLNLSVAYSGGWQSKPAEWTFGAAANFGVRGRQNDPTEFENKRFRGAPNYMYFRSDGSIRWRLPASMNLLLSVSGQYSVDPLISNEQFSITGADGVRGYLEAEELGDSGIKGGLQLGTPRLPLWAKRVQLDGFLFFDAGDFSLQQPLDSDRKHADLYSWGTGLNVGAFNHVNASLTWAYPLRDANVTQRGNQRWLFLLRGNW